MSEGFWTGANWVWSNWDTIKRRLEPVFRLFRRSGDVPLNVRPILIIGPGGVGKSTLAKLHAGQLDWLLGEPWKYEQSFAIQETKLHGSDNIEVIVAPGQSLQRNLQWDGLGTEIAQSYYQGVIVVSAYGYHSRIGRYQDHALYQNNKETFRANYLVSCRNTEIESLKILKQSILTNTKKCWLLSVIAKEDLWYSEKKQVEEWYLTDRYGSLIQSLMGQNGTRRLRVETVAVSLLIHNFRAENGEIVAKNVAGYDQRLQIDSIQRLLELIAGLVEWEGNT
jgi:hypothetical protein